LALRLVKLACFSHGYENWAKVEEFEVVRRR